MTFNQLIDMANKPEYSEDPDFHTFDKRHYAQKWVNEWIEGADRAMGKEFPENSSPLVEWNAALKTYYEEAGEDLTSYWYVDRLLRCFRRAGEKLGREGVALSTEWRAASAVVVFLLEQAKALSLGGNPLAAVIVAGFVLKSYNEKYRTKSPSSEQDRWNELFAASLKLPPSINESSGVIANMIERLIAFLA